MLADALAVSVTGASVDLSAAEDILVHEHVLYDHTSRYIPPPALDLVDAEEDITLGRLATIRQHAHHHLASLRGPPREVCEAELLALRDGRPAGKAVIVCATVGNGRDLRGLIALSKATGVSIIASAGVSFDEAARAEGAVAMVEDDQDASHCDVLSSRLVEELTNGVLVPGHEERVRCGCLSAGDGVGVLAAEPMLPSEDARRAREVTLRVLGAAQMRTGAPVLLPLPMPPALSAAQQFADGVVASVRALVSLFSP